MPVVPETPEDLAFRIADIKVIPAVQDFGKIAELRHKRAAFVVFTRNICDKAGVVDRGDVEADEVHAAFINNKVGDIAVCSGFDLMKPFRSYLFQSLAFLVI